VLRLPIAANAAPQFQQIGNLLVMSNANVQVQYNLNTGTADFYWQNSKKISAFYSGVTLSSGYVRNTSYTNRIWSAVSSNQVVVTSTGNGNPPMKQYFTLDQNDSFLTRVEMTGASLSASWMGAVVADTTGCVDLGSYNDDRALYVPFDNDHFTRYNAMSINTSSTGYEAAAFYDNTTRNGLVVGSVTHDQWKTGVHWDGSINKNNRLDYLYVYGGQNSPWDVAPHGSVTGNTISSPVMFVGFGTDWRTVMENYANENTNFAPKLAWSGGVPFGWNSWGVIQASISHAAAIAVSDNIYNNLQPNNFNNNGTAYVNLDSYWKNLSSSD